MNKRVAWCLSGLLWSVAMPVFAQAYPSKPVRWVVPYPAGGPLDEVARAVGQRLTAAWNQQVIVDNRSGADGSLQHLAMESLQSMADIKMNHVPYKGAAPAFVDLLSGQVEVMFANIVGVLPHVWNKKVRPIAVSASRGSPVLPDVPGVAATLPQFDLDGWMGVFVRVGTPADIIAKLHKDLAAALDNADLKERFAKRGAEVVVGGPEALAKIVREETVRYAKIIKSVGILPQ